MTSGVDVAADVETAEPVAAAPLSGIRVLELTHAWAGPLCGMMLADMGAEVIKVEAPTQPSEARGGFPYVAGESVIFMMTHRNKKSITLDLKTASGLDAFKRLLTTTDVLVQNMRPGALDRLGLSFEEVHKINPQLIYASISGYGSTGPDAGMAGVDQAAIARSGLAATTMEGPETQPVALGTPVCDYMAAMWTCHGILCAYLARQKIGKGQRVEGSLLGAGLSLMIGPTAMHFHKPDYSGLKTSINGPSEFFLAKDRRFVAVFASYPALWDRFVHALDVPELNEDRFHTREQRTANARALAGLLAPVFASKPSLEWARLLREAGVPCSRVNTIGEALEDPQVQAMRLVQKQDHPKAGPIHVLATPVLLSETPGQIIAPAPLLGQDTDAVLEASNFTRDEIDALRASKVIG